MVQIGKYRRPGIFIEEYDNSVISSPTVGGSAPLVMGFSKKGPINTPVLLRNLNDLERIYGPLDRTLERQGSYFHRTLAKILETNQVYGMNLLSTSDVLDKIEYQSLATAADKSNGTKTEEAYRLFHDTTGFWKRDTDAFNTLVGNDAGQSGRVLSITNMSDKYITVFMFKSKLPGFNRTLLEWYGSVDKVPAYVSPLDYASDYMVDVLVVSGDWSNYAQLSVDSRWSQYFNGDGLQKSKVSDFANDRNIGLLAYYEGVSLIPYFRDNNNRNIFIETVINAETDRTGLFCAFDADKLEKEYNTGLLDLVGNNLVGTNDLIDNGQESIDFMSYNVSLIQNVGYASTPLDIAGGSTGQNVVAFGPSMSLVRTTWGGANRTAHFSEEYVAGVNYATASASLAGTNSITIGYTLADPSLGSLTSSNAYAIIGGEKVLVNGGTVGTFTFSIPRTLYTVTATPTDYYSVVHIDATTGNLVLTNGTIGGVEPTIPAADIALSKVRLTVTNGLISQGGSPSSTPTITHLSVGTAGYLPLVKDVDYTVTQPVSGTIRVTFLDTAGVDVTNNYDRHRSIRLFNYLVSMLDSSQARKMTMLKDMVTMEKLSLENASISNIVISTASNKSFDLALGVTTVPPDILAGNLVFYKYDNEFVLGTDGVNTRATVGTPSYGVVAKYSDFYEDYANGNINTGDFFYKNLTDPTDPMRVVFQTSGTFSYITFDRLPWTVTGTETILVPDSTLNKGTIELDGDTNYRTSLADPVTGATYGAGYYSYRTVGDLVAEDLDGVKRVWDAEAKVYLQMYQETDEDLKVKFMDSLLESIEPIDTSLDIDFTVKSYQSNYRQTVEIETPSGYTPVVNKILVNGSRYTEIKIGDYLEAYVDPAIELAAGEMPRKLTRILSKRLYSGDTSLVEITCDAAIHKYQVPDGLGGYDLQTTRYTTMDDYVSVYKALPLKGFRVREASMPNGTEDRQNDILNVVAKGTPLFKAVCNKEALDIRYLVDSFGLGLRERSKQQLVDICGERLDCFGFISMPSAKSFKNSTSPSFVNSDGVLQSSLIASGGDLESSPAFLYSLGDGRGSSAVGYFFPYVKVNDNGRPIDVPPAMHVASAYLRKLNSASSNIVPWTIVAGVVNGRITNIANVEMDLTPEDIENLNQAQMNPIVYKRNRGWVIETENTAQTLFRSALSYIHVREVLIEIERELASMLQEFQWRYNTPEVRAEIKRKADSICEKYVNRNGITNYFNKCDGENNTPELIDNQIGLLQTFLEPIKGMGIIVNEITVLRTGAIQSGGFILNA